MLAQVNTIARSLDAILAELEPGYKGSRQAIQTQVSALPGQYQAEESGLRAQLDEANTGILNQARQRGLGFSGIPVGEQTKYAATQFAPAVARLKSDQITRRTTLDEALNSLERDRRNTGLNIYQKELDRDEAARQFDKQLAAQRDAEARAAAASAGSGFSFGGGGSIAPTASGGVAKMTPKGNGTFGFTDANGRPISAATFAAQKGVPFRSVLSAMAQAGDKGAKTALGFVGDDFGYDPRKVTNPNLANLYNALVWGTGRSAKAPKSGGGGGW